MTEQSLSHLKALESESIEIFREVAASFERPVMMYSIGKDSSVLLHLARKAFFPSRIPFPVLHIDTTWKFKEMIAFRDRMAKEHGFELIVHTNQEGVAANINPFDHGSARYTDIMKTQALRQALNAGGYDAAIGGARRDEEKSPRQGAHLLAPQRAARLGSQEPAARALAHLQHPPRAGREHARLPALATGPSSTSGPTSIPSRSRSPALFRPEAAGGRALRHADHDR